MKKKITASVVAFALALALPAAAFAVEKSVEASPIAGSSWVKADVEGANVDEVYVNGAEDVKVQTGVSTAESISSVEASLEAKIAEATKGTDKSQDEKDAIAKEMRENFYGTPVYDKYGQLTGYEGGYLEAYNNKINEIQKGATDPESKYFGATHLETMVLTGNVKAGQTATVEIYLTNKPAQGKTMQVTCVILHETQAPQYVTVTVGEDGMISIPGLTEFSAIDMWITPLAEAAGVTNIGDAADTTDDPSDDANTAADDNTASDNADKVTDEGATPAGKSPKTGF